MRRLLIDIWCVFIPLYLKERIELLFFILGDYPQDLRVKELSEDEVEIQWKPPKMFQSIQLNYLVHCYRLNDQKIHTKTHELIAKKTSCVLDEMQKDVMYKISVWSIQATTQKKKGLPSQTKYTLREKGIYSKTVTIVGCLNFNSIIKFTYWCSVSLISWI